MADKYSERTYNLAKDKKIIEQEGPSGAIGGGQVMSPEIMAIFQEAAGQEEAKFQPIAFPGLYAEHPLTSIVESFGLDQRLHVRWKNKEIRIEQLDKELERGTKKWSKEKIASLQRMLGIYDFPGVEPGRYGKLTKQTHKLYLISRHSEKGIGWGATQSVLRNFREETKEKKKLIEEQRRQQDINKGAQLANLRSASGAFWQRFTGETPTEGNVSWLTKRFEEGWDDWKMYSYIRSTPGFKKKYPGITENMLPSEYEQLQSDVTNTWIKYKGRVPTPEEFVNHINGGWRNEK